MYYPCLKRARRRSKSLQKRQLERMNKLYTSPREGISYQAECFTPQRTLTRSPPNHRTVNENIPPQANNSSSPLETPSTPATDTDVNKLSYEIGDGALREVQESCFTPRQTLKRSPPRRAVSKSRDKSSIMDNTDNQTDNKHSNSSAGDCIEVMNAVPPQRHWEIPRTPVTNTVCSSVQYQQFQVQLSTGQSNKKSTPVRVKTPTHPLSHSNKAVSTRKATALDQQQSDNGQSNVVIHSVNPSPIPEDRKGDPSSTISPPISVAKSKRDVPNLPNLKCTENDMAYLQHMRNIKQLTELRSQSDDLVKALKKAREEKELLEHEARKIDSDVHSIQIKVLEVSSAVQTLLPCPEAGGREKQHHESCEITQTKLAQLKRLNQLTAAEVERAARETKEKLEQVNKTTLKLNNEIHTLEMRHADEKATLQSGLRSTQDEVMKAEKRNHKVTAQHQTAQDELQTLQTQLASFKLSDPPGTVEDSKQRREEKLKEKRQMEQRLAMITRRCELYVQRHKMLKEMGI